MNIPRDIATRIDQEAKEYSQKVHDQVGDKKHLRIKTIAYYAYKEAAEKYTARIRAAEEQMERMAKAFEQISERYSTQYVAGVVAREALTDLNTYKQQKDGTVNR